MQLTSLVLNKRDIMKEQILGKEKNLKKLKLRT